MIKWIDKWLAWPIAVVIFVGTFLLIGRFVCALLYALGVGRY